MIYRLFLERSYSIWLSQNILHFVIEIGCFKICAWVNQVDKKSGISEDIANDDVDKFR